MSFNFKEELESLDFKTPEAIAQAILESIVGELKKAQISFKDLYSLLFSVEEHSKSYSPLYGSLDTYSIYPISIRYYLRNTSGGKINESHMVTYIEYTQREEAISIAEAIEKELQREGLKCEDKTCFYPLRPKDFEVIF